MLSDKTAAEFVARLESLKSEEELRKLQRYFKTGKGEYGEGDVFMGVRMGHVFALAKEFIGLPAAEIDILLQSPIHEVRAGALSIMGQQAKQKKITQERRKELFDLYLRRIDHIDNWDLVDLSAHYVVGGYLYDKPRDLLYTLARSDSVWKRRIAIFSTAYFIRQGDVEDTYKLTEILLDDPHDLVHKAAGWMLRAAGDVDRERLVRFLDAHAAKMPRVMLRNALEHFDKQARTRYLNMK